jgi:hypothetical protein
VRLGMQPRRSEIQGGARAVSPAVRQCIAPWRVDAGIPNGSIGASDGASYVDEDHLSHGGAAVGKRGLAPVGAACWWSALTGLYIAER